MRNHPKMGQKLTIKTGPLKGQYFEVINYLVTQYQGKQIHKIKAQHLTTAMVNRGLPLDDDTVFGRFWPSMGYGCVHDSELKLQVVKDKETGEAKIETPPELENVKPIRGKRKKKNENETPAG